MTSKMKIPLMQTYDKIFAEDDFLSNVCLIGPTKAGKTQVAKVILREYLKHFDMCFLLTNSASRQQYKNYFHPSMIIDVEHKTLEKTWANLLYEIESINSSAVNIKDQNGDPTKLKYLLMIDDLSDELKVLTRLSNIRHYGVSTLILTHDPNTLPTNCRTQIQTWIVHQNVSLSGYKNFDFKNDFQDFVSTRQDSSEKRTFFVNAPSYKAHIKLNKEDIERNKEFILPFSNFSFDTKRMLNWFNNEVEKRRSQVSRYANGLTIQLLSSE